MKHLGRFILRWSYLLLLASSSAYLIFQVVQRTDWFRDRLYRQLVAGELGQQKRAAVALARLGAEPQLLLALKADSSSTREFAQRALEYVWFNAAGRQAFQMTQDANAAAEQDNFDQALTLLDRVIKKHPEFAEAWNRRASVYWQMGEYTRSMADCERTLRLNPNHYGAWQGLGICQLELGQVAEACRSLREALRIRPHDQSTGRSLRRCEELLRIYPRPGPDRNTTLLI